MIFFFKRKNTKLSQRICTFLNFFRIFTPSVFFSQKSRKNPQKPMKFLFFLSFFILTISAKIIIVLVSASPTSSFIRSQYLQKLNYHDSPSLLLEHFYDLLGPNLCFTERDSFSLIQLCLRHGFRRMELERLRSTGLVVSAKTEPISEIEVVGGSSKTDLEDSKRAFEVQRVRFDVEEGEDQDDDVNERVDENDDDDDDYDYDDDEEEPSFFSSIFGRSKKEQHSAKNTKQKYRLLKQRPMSKYLRQELENFFAAASDESAASLDAAFSIRSKEKSFDRRFGSPFRADDAALTERRKELGALANITSEIYGRFDPRLSKSIKFVSPGEAQMIFPNGDPCYYHHEQQGEEYPTWTTYLRFVCSTHDVGSEAASAYFFHKQKELVSEDDEEFSAGTNSIRWDVRVNAPLCLVNVFVFTDKVC